MMPWDGVMKYDQIKEFSDEEFRRLTGVKRSAFKKMVEILTAADQEKKARGGRKSKLSIENRLLMALEYIREYRTYFHVAASYGLSESVVYKIVRWVEDTLIQDPVFALPGRIGVESMNFEKCNTKTQRYEDTKSEEDISQQII